MLTTKSLHGAVQLVLAGSLLLLVPGPPVARAENWRFVFFSDSQDPAWGPWMNTNLLGELAIAVTNEKASFVLFGGDMANSPQPLVPYVWSNLMAPVLEAGIPIYPVIGNHDAFQASYVDAFGSAIPANGPSGEIDRTYAIAHENALIVGLDAFVGTNDYRVNYGWLSALLATNQLPHVFVFSHPPAFKVVHSNCLGAWPEERDALWRVLTRAGCRIYFCGHDHFFDHSRLDDGDGEPGNDVHQYISGTAGAAFYADNNYDGTNGFWTPVRVFHEASFGYVLIEIDRDTVTVTWKHRVSPAVFEATSDVFTYVAPLRLNVLVERRRLLLTWPAGATLQCSPDVAGPFTTVPNAYPPYTVDNIDRATFFYRVVK